MSEPLVMLPSFCPGLGASASPFVRGCRLVVGFALLLAALALHVTPARAQNGWLSQDIGNATFGTTTVKDAQFSLAGSGADIWDRADGFRYLYQSWAGDGSVVVRLTNLVAQQSWAKLGLMARESLAADARHVSVFTTRTNGTGLHWRATTGGETEMTPFTVYTSLVPRWLKLVRSGSIFIGYESVDGQAWYEVGRTELDLGATIYVGFALTSHREREFAVATIDNLAVTGSVPSAAPPTVAAFTNVARSELVGRADDTHRVVFSKPVTGVTPASFVVVVLGGDVTSGTITGIEPIGANGTSYYVHSRVVYASTSGARYRIDLPASSNDISDTEGAALVGGATGPVLTTRGSPWRIARVQGPAAGAYVTGQVLTIEVDYGVTGMVVTGTPSIPVTIGGNARAARYTGMVSGTAASTLRFSYTVQADDSDTDGIAIAGLIDITGATITGGNGSSALLDFTPPFTGGVRVNLPNGPVWAANDIGAVGTPGTTGISGNAVTLRGAGADIWGAQDAFRYFSQTLTGDGELIARVAALDRTDAWAKAGLMLRTSNSANGPNIFLGINPDYTLLLQHRATTAGETILDRIDYRWPPLWLRISRIGDKVITASSQDGTSWSGFGTFSLAPEAIVFLGLAVTSHRPGTLASATFDQVLFRRAAEPPPPEPAPVAPSNLRLTGISESRIGLRWDDNTTDEVEFELERAAGSEPFVRIARPTANATSHADDTVQPGIAYSYRIRANTHSKGYTAYSNVLTVTLPQGALAWSKDRIGGPLVSSFFEVDGSTLRLGGVGGDMWGTADDFYFVHRPLTGDGEIRATVDRFTGTDPWAKVGLMIRESAAPGARHALVYLTPINGIGSHVRTTADGVTQNTPGPWWVSAPYTLRLVRQGNQFSAYASADGNVWTLVSTQTLDLPSDVLIGIAISPHDLRAVEATLSNVQITKP